MPYTLDEVADRVRRRLELEGSGFADETAELYPWINDARARHIEMLSQKIGIQAGSEELTVTTVANTAQYDLTTLTSGRTILRIYRVDLEIDDLRIPIEEFEPTDRVLFTSGRTWRGERPKWTHTPKTITFDPPPDGVHTVRLAVVAYPTPLTNPTAELVDVLDGSVEWIILEVMIQMAAKEETDTAHWERRQEIQVQRIIDLYKPLAKASPKVIANHRELYEDDDLDLLLFW